MRATNPKAPEMTMKDTKETMNSGLSMTERELLCSQLRQIEDTVPPREVWERIKAQARAEGHFRRRMGEGAKWFAGSGIAAAVVVGVLNVPLQSSLPDGSSGNDNISATPPVSAAIGNEVPPGLTALMVQSQQIERHLRALPGEPRLVRAGTAATIVELQDRIATIDYVLSDPEVGMDPEQVEAYWRERVRLMNSLLNLRRAQAQQMAF